MCFYLSVSENMCAHGFIITIPVLQSNLNVMSQPDLHRPHLANHNSALFASFLHQFGAQIRDTAALLKPSVGLQEEGGITE